jgi:hypothetical protein
MDTHIVALVVAPLGVLLLSLSALAGVHAYRVYLLCLDIKKAAAVAAKLEQETLRFHFEG